MKWRVTLFRRNMPLISPIAGFRHKNFFNAKCIMHNWPSPDVFWHKNISLFLDTRTDFFRHKNRRTYFVCLRNVCLSVFLDIQTWPPCLMGVLRTWIDFLDIRTEEQILSVCTMFVCLFFWTYRQTDMTSLENKDKKTRYKFVFIAMITYFWSSIFICLNRWCYEEFSFNINHHNLDRLLKFEMGGIKG